MTTSLSNPRYVYVMCERRRSKPQSRTTSHATLNGVCREYTVPNLNEVSDSGDVIIQEQGFSIVDPHVPALFISLSGLLNSSLGPHRNQILLVGHHRPGGVRRLISPGLRPIKSRSAASRDVPQRMTYVDFARFVPFESDDDTLPSASLLNCRLLRLRIQDGKDMIERREGCWRAREIGG
jgi:hypothetical protein